MNATVAKSEGLTRFRKWLVVLIAGLVIMLAGAEIFCRFYLKLGDPPLFMNDPEIGYINKPDQTCNRFGNLVHFNAYSMRSDDFSPHKTAPAELRIIAIGDSVIFAGVRTDQRLVGTSLLKEDLKKKLNCPVEVGNISCNGWGPLNEWPYVRRFGLFDANILIIELRSGSVHSAFNTNSIVDVDPNFPSHKPICALGEAVTRYLPNVFPSLFHKASIEGYHDAVEDPQVFEENMAAVNDMINSAKAIGATPCIVMHWLRPELLRSKNEPAWRPKGFEEIAAAANRSGVRVWDMHDVEARDVATIYRDDYHLNDAGQRDLAGVFEAAVLNLYTNNINSRKSITPSRD